jgi:adenosyl cobinamide kinase/adenosyl cobinamide phosphate guanylyltransferase
MVFNEYVKLREEKFGTVIFETLREKVFVTNETGKQIVNLIQKGYSYNDIVKSLKDDYSDKEGVIESEVKDFLSQLKINNIIK